MTRLELAIYEAENNGDIDIYTRDMMLDIINESADDVKKLVDRYHDIERQIEDVKRGKSSSDNYLSLKRELSDLERDIEKEVSIYKKELAAKKGAPEKSGMYKNVKCDDSDRKLMADMRKINQALTVVKQTRKKLEAEVAKGKMVGSRHVMRSKLDNMERDLKSGRKDGINRMKAKLRTAKESVLEDIYEAELNGEITPAERQSLIDYMNI